MNRGAVSVRLRSVTADHRRDLTLSQFIHDHHGDIVRQFVTFARTLMPAGADMTERELRDHAEDLLTAIVVDMGTSQSMEEQSNKSKGWGTAQAMAASGELHADARMHHGFSLTSLLAEFHALRASVRRLYEVSGASDLAGVRRFNESVDEALMVSTTRYTERMDHLRHQFIGILGHDLRNPLAAITTGASLLALPEAKPWAAIAQGASTGSTLDPKLLRVAGCVGLARARARARARAACLSSQGSD